MEKKTTETVSQSIYRQLLEHGGWVKSGELEKWDCIGATGSTITRKARLLEDDNYLEVKYDESTHHANYRALRTKAEREDYARIKSLPTHMAEPAEEPPETVIPEHLPEYRVRYEKDGIYTVRFTESKEQADEWLKTLPKAVRV
jgi:hypothetical protein